MYIFNCPFLPSSLSSLLPCLLSSLLPPFLPSFLVSFLLSFLVSFLPNFYLPFSSFLLFFFLVLPSLPSLRPSFLPSPSLHQTIYQTVFFVLLKFAPGTRCKFKTMLICFCVVFNTDLHSEYWYRAYTNECTDTAQRPLPTKRSSGKHICRSCSILLRRWLVKVSCNFQHLYIDRSVLTEC